MENTEVFVSTTTRTWHDFLERMRQPSAAEFVKAIKSFIVTFSNNAADPERDSTAVQEFFGNMEVAFRAHPLWAGRTEEEMDNASEGLEKYIMTKLFPRVFATHPDDVKIDNELHEKSALVQQFIRPEHLDIRPTYQNESAWVLAQKELQKINSFKAPRDKLACILSCCKVISKLLFDASISANENPPGADDFLPVLIYVTIKANPPQLHSNLLYIQRYRNQSRLVGEAAYVFTNMLSAESFILDVDAKALSMDETEFMKNMESARTLISGLSADYNGDNMQTESEIVSNSKLKEIPSVSDLENKGATMLVTEEKVSGNFQNFPFLYSKAGDLTVGDVEELLNGYKQLAFKYVCLAKGLGVPVLQHQDPKTRVRDKEGVEYGGILAQPPESQIGGATMEVWKDRENMGFGGDDDKTEGIRKVSGVSAKSSEAGIGGETVHPPEGNTGVELDDQIDNDRVECGETDHVGASTPESAVAADVSQIQNTDNGSEPWREAQNGKAGK